MYDRMHHWCDVWDNMMADSIRHSDVSDVIWGGSIGHWWCTHVVEVMDDSRCVDAAVHGGV